MKRNPSAIRLLCLLVAVELLLAVALPLLAEPRSPLPPWPEPNPISQLKWDAVPTPIRDNSTATIGAEGATLVEGWSGHALQRKGLVLSPLVMPGLNEKGVANLGFRQGCVRFWFAPSWSSGTGQGQVARLAEWMVTDGKEVGTLWALSVNESGTAISLGSQGAEVLRAEINWSAGGFHQVALSYNESGTELVIDGVLVATGGGLLAVEPKISGLVIGSDWQGFQVAGGLFDEVLCFSEPMIPEDVAFNYRALSYTAALGPLTKEEMAWWFSRAKVSAEVQPTVSYRWSTNNLCPTNGPLHLTNVVCVIESNELVTVEIDVAGPDWTNGLPYDVFATTNLAGATATNGAWYWITNTFSCSTVVLSNQSWLPTLYILGTPQDDDLDGLTSAFETLVSATNPNNSDTDGDGIPDGWEWNHGLNPHDAADAADDPDGDWLTNLQEYNGGTNSTNPNDVMVMTWGQDHSGQLIVPLNVRNVAKVTGGWDYSLALRLDGTVASWGDSTNIFGDVTGGIALSAGAYHALTLKADGTLVAWGDWWPDVGTFSPANIPSGLSNVVAIASGADHDLALRADGSVVAWGYYGNSPYNPLPSNLPPAKGIAAGWEHSAVLLTDGTVRAFGPNLFTVTNVPAGLSGVSAIAAGAYHTLALKADGTVVAWGAGTNNSGSLFNYGQAMVPAGLSNVVAVSAGGFYSMALKADGTVAVWGLSSVGQCPSTSGDETRVTGIGSGEEHALALRSGRLTPLIVTQPVSRIALAGSTIQFTVAALGLAGVQYQWQFGGVNILGATNAILVLANVSATNEGSYRAIVSNGAGAVLSSNAVFQLVTPPVILSRSMPTNPTLIYHTNVTLGVEATGQFTDFPLSYQWRLNGTNLAGATSSNYTVIVSDSGLYSVTVSNAVGGTSAVWQVTMTYEGSYMTSGTLAHHLSTNAVSYAAGYAGNSNDQTVVSGWTYATYTNENMALLTNAVWSTNCWLKGVRGLSATAIGHTNSEGGRALKTMVSPRHYLFATHTPGSQPVAFLGTNNVIYWRTTLQWVDLGNDTAVGILDADLPPSVGYLPVLPANFTNYLPTATYSFVQGIGMNQDMRVFSQPMTFGYPNTFVWFSTVTPPLGLGTNWNVTIRGGDSSGPERLLVDNQLVSVSHNSGQNSGPRYAYQLNAINQAMHHLSTNNNIGSDYQLTLFSLTNWPSIR